MYTPSFILCQMDPYVYPSFIFYQVNPYVYP